MLLVCWRFYDEWGVFLVGGFIGLTVGSLFLLFKFRLVPLSRPSLLKYERFPCFLALLTSILSSLALVSGCVAGGLIGTLLSGEHEETILTRIVNKNSLTIFLAMFAVATLIFLTAIKTTMRKHDKQQARGV